MSTCEIIRNMNKMAAEIGIVMGVVFVAMGFAYGNSGVWILGFILLGLGGVARAKVKKAGGND